jgi:hypothetical protein
VQDHTKGHQKDFWLYHAELSALAEHVINQSHHIHFEVTMVLVK